MEDSITPAAEHTGYTPDLAKLKRMFAESRDLTAVARGEADTDDDYYNGFQWTAEERLKLAERKQPDNVFNLVRPTVNGTIGVIKKGATDPKAYGRTPKDNDSADVASKTLRYMADYNHFDALKEDVALDYLVKGSGAALIEVDEKRRVALAQIRWEEFFYDPRARRKDFKDARYMGIAKWRFVDEVARQYPDSADEITGTMSGGSGLPIDQSFRDRPNGSISGWVDPKQRRIMVVEIYHNDDGWKRCVFYGGGILKSEESQYKDEDGVPHCPIEAQSCYIDRENNRYGYVRDMRGPQDEVNKRHSKSLHLLNSRQVQENQPGMLQGEDRELVRVEAQRPDGVLPSGAQIVPNNDLVQGHVQLLAEAKSMIERMGPAPETLGRQDASASGRSQLIRQQSGLTELAVVLGGLEDWELRMYRQMWARAKQFWTAPDYIRVTDDEKAPTYIGINQPQMGEQQQPLLDPITQQPIMNPMTGAPVMQTVQAVLGYENSLAEMDVDITIDTTPETANVQQEQFQMLVELAKIGGLGQNPGPILFEASQLSNKADIAEKLKAQQEQSQPQPDPLAAKAQEADIGKTDAEAAFKRAQTAETMMGLEHASRNGFGMAPQGQPAYPPPGSTGDQLPVGA